MRKLIILTCAATAVAVLHACHRKEISVYGPIAYPLQVPAFVKTYVGDIPVPADNPLTFEGVALGRKLFYEKMLSNDNTMSCATCHKQEFGFSDPRPFSKGTSGALGGRNTMAVINLAYSKNFFWDGRRGSMEGQAHDPVSNPIEMAAKWTDVVSKLQADSKYPKLFYQAFGTTTIDSILVTKAIAQFERTLISFNSRFDKYYYKGDSSALTAQEKSGMAIFTGKGMCNNCHLMNTLLTDDMLRNNGLDVNPADDGQMKATGLATDRAKFKVPTLRNIAVTAPYMHDSRFATLEAVVEHYSSGVQQASPNIDEHMPDFGSGLHLTTQEKADLVAFLKTFSDSTFLNNPDYAEPK